MEQSYIPLYYCAKIVCWNNSKKKQAICGLQFKRAHLQWSSREFREHTAMRAFEFSNPTTSDTHPLKSSHFLFFFPDNSTHCERRIQIYETGSFSFKLLQTITWFPYFPNSFECNSDYLDEVYPCKMMVTVPISSLIVFCVLILLIFGKAQI